MIDSGDTAWLLVSTALVLLMTPGVAFFYGGLVRGKNAAATIMHSFITVAEILEGKRFQTPGAVGRHELEPRMPGVQ